MQISWKILGIVAIPISLLGYPKSSFTYFIPIYKIYPQKESPFFVHGKRREGIVANSSRRSPSFSILLYSTQVYSLSFFYFIYFISFSRFFSLSLSLSLLFLSRSTLCILVQKYSQFLVDKKVTQLFLSLLISYKVYIHAR